MKTHLTDSLEATQDGTEASRIVANCVHCGFCLATCPTYQVTGDELDSPRGRIYLIKQVLEGHTPTATTQTHLDRCLTCRACETTCPSGVEFGRLLDIGRRLVSEEVPRSPTGKLMRTVLRNGLTSKVFKPALRTGQALRAALPAGLQARVPEHRAPGSWPDRRHERQMLLLAGCVQPGLAPRINFATARVLDALGIELIVANGSACCGAIRQHLDDQPGALDDARRNIDAWWPHIERGVEALVMNASGCGAMVREYGYLLAQDVRYADKAARVSEMTRDISEILSTMTPELGRLPGAHPSQRVVFHPPCTLQHAQGVRDVVEPMLSSLGAEVLSFTDAHLCCGSAGTYSILQPDMANELRDRKLAALTAPAPEIILSANIGCITHLQGAASVPVRHWIEWLDDRLPAAPSQ